MTVEKTRDLLSQCSRMNRIAAGDGMHKERFLNLCWKLGPFRYHRRAKALQDTLLILAERGIFCRRRADGASLVVPAGERTRKGMNLW